MAPDRTDSERNFRLASAHLKPPTARSLPGHWEGDLLMGKGGRSAIATLVERSSRYAILVHLPNGRTAEAVRLALMRELKRLPAELKKTLTWDQGKEVAEHAKFRIATNVSVVFCDHSPWQRGSNENTNGLLRQYFLKNMDLSAVSRSPGLPVGPGGRCARAQFAPSTDPGLDETMRGVQPGCCLDPLRPPFCGKTARVRRRVTRIIGERDGRMLSLKSDCITLDGVVCSGQHSLGRWFCPAPSAESFLIGGSAG